MGKRIEDLLGEQGIDTPLTGHQAEDVRSSAWYSFVSEIEELRESGEVAWAEETLAGIQETVARTKRVSAAQQRAVDNIAAKRGTPSGRGGRRRYEGFR